MKPLTKEDIAKKTDENEMNSYYEDDVLSALALFDDFIDKAVKTIENKPKHMKDEDDFYDNIVIGHLLAAKGKLKNCFQIGDKK